MKWTRRDTRYLTVIVLLSAVLIALLLADRIGPIVAQRAQDKAQQQVKVKGGTFHPSGDGGGVIIDDAPALRKQRAPAARMEQGEVIKIQPGMTRTELAEALGMSPDDLPPSEEIGVIDD